MTKPGILYRQLSPDTWSTTTLRTSAGSLTLPDRNRTHGKQGLGIEPMPLRWVLLLNSIAR